MSKIKNKMKELEQEIRLKKRKKAIKKAIIKIFIFIIIVAFVVVVLFAKQIFGENSEFAQSVKGIDSIGEWFIDNFSTIVNTFLYIFIIYLITKAVRMALKGSQKAFKKGRAVMNLIDSFVKYAGFIVMLIVVLRALGVDTSAVITSIGVLGLVVGLGAQSLIEDIISGLFIVFERTFDVGDVVVYDGFRGTVKEIGLRTTQIIDAGGDILTINNSDIRKIINMTNDLSIAICDVSVEYSESLEHVENVIQRNIEKIKRDIPTIIEGPFYLGVNALADSGVVIRITARCNETDRFQTVRDMNREIKLIFDRNNINIPFPQIVINEGVKRLKAEPKVEAKADVVVEAITEVKAAPKADAKVEVKAAPKTEVKAAPKTEVKAAPKAAPKTEVKGASKAASKASPKAASKE